MYVYNFEPVLYSTDESPLEMFNHDDELLSEQYEQKDHSAIPGTIRHRSHYKRHMSSTEK